MESSAQKPKTTPPPKTPASKTPASKTTTASHDEDAVQGIIKKYSAIASAAALVPVPSLDLATLVGVQVKMVHSISKEHKVEKLSNSAVKMAISSLASALPSGTIATAGASILKVIPGIGQAVSMVASPGYYAAATYAVGQVFNAHFASGETLLNFDAEEAGAAYQTYYNQKAP